MLWDPRRPCAEARQSARTKDHGRRAMEGEGGEGGEGLKIAEFRRGELDRHHIVPACARAKAEPSPAGMGRQENARDGRMPAERRLQRSAMARGVDG